MDLEGRQHIVVDAEWTPRFCPHCGSRDIRSYADGVVCPDCDGVFDIDYFPPGEKTEE